MVAGRRDGFDYIATFGVRGDDGTRLLNVIQSTRRERGESPLPRVEQLADLEALDVSQEQMRVLEDSRGLLMEQNVLLARLVPEDADAAPRESR